MININRRTKAIEAMNYCEKHGIMYQLKWDFSNQYQLAVPFTEQEQEIEHHLEKWEKS